MAQLHARGISTTDLPNAADEVKKRRRYKHLPWQPSFYGQAQNLSAADWASAAVRDMSTASLSFLSHECRPDVCHKGKVGKMGYCRLMFWQWKYVIKNRGTEWKRVHGKQLVPKPDPSMNVPINDIPPNVGKALVQQHHPFFIKCNPCILHGGRCNHDVGPLIRLPRASVVDPSHLTEPECNRERVQQCVQAMAAAINDANFYCTNYASKEQPHIEGLFQSFATALQGLQAHLPDDIDQTDYARRVLFRMMCVTNRGLHKGMPEMVAYLFNKNIFLCSHDFKPLLLRPLRDKVLNLCRRFTDAPPSAAADGALDDQFTLHTLPGEAEKVLRNNHLDYALRPPELEDFPL